MACRNLCLRIGVSGSYKDGMNYCSKCEVYYLSEGGTHCFCCGRKLRFRARHRRR